LAPVARQAARTALALKPNLGRAYGAIGQLARSDFAWAEAIANLSKAAVLDPSDPVGASALGYALFIVGEHQHAERLFVEAQRLDPIAHSVAALVLAFSAFNRGDDDTAKSRAEWLTHSVSEADRAIGQTLLAAIARSEGNYAEAEDRFRIAASLSHRSQELADALAQAIKTRAAIPSARAALMKEATRDPTFEPELLLILIGDNEGFFDAVDARLAKGDKVRTMNYIAMAWRVFSSGDSANARFKVLMRKVGLVDYWKKHGWPDRCRAKGEDDFECS
jgi:tetratricopeptide (TPR) repeat protein